MPYELYTRSINRITIAPLWPKLLNSKHIRKSSTPFATESRLGMDSYADMSCAGRHTRIVEYIDIYELSTHCLITTR